MATVNAVATGVWSNTAVTFGGVEPQPGDIVQSNGFTVTIDVDITVAELLSTGGGFLVSGNSRVINAKLRSVNSELLQFNSTCNLTINGDVEAGSFMCIRIGNSHPSTLTINGNVTGSVLGSGGSGIRTSGSITALIVNGNVITVNGGNSWGIIHEAGNIPTTVNGDLIPGPQAAIWNQGNGSITVNGTAFGHPTLTSGGAGYQAIGSTVSVVKIRRIQALSGGVAAIGSTNSIVRVAEFIAGPNGQLPATNFWRFDPTIGPLIFSGLNAEGDTVFLADPIDIGDPPAESDVRDQTVYAHGNRVGTLKVPTKFQTAKDVPVDDTLGEAVLTVQDVQDAVGLTEPNLGAKLDAIPTPISFGKTTQIFLSDKGNRQIIWPSPNKTITGTIQWSGQEAKPIEGDIHFRETVGGVHFYDWEYNALDRPEMIGWGLINLQDDVYVDEPLVVSFTELGMPDGPLTQTVTFAATSGVNAPVAGLVVRIAGRQLVTATNGQFAIPLNPGTYPAELISPSGFELLDPITVTVADQPVIVPISMTARVPNANSNELLIDTLLSATDQFGVPITNGRVTAEVIAVPVFASQMLVANARQSRSFDSGGTIVMPLYRSLTYRFVVVANGGLKAEFTRTVPADGDQFVIEAIVG